MPANLEQTPSTEGLNPPKPVLSRYPRLLVLDEAVEDALKIYLDNEIANHRAERSVWEDDVISQQRDYYAKPADAEQKRAVGQASLVIPLTAIAVETIHARNMTQLYGLTQLVSVTATNKDLTDTVQPFESYLDHELKYTCKFKENFESASLEFTKYGTGIARAEWEEEVRYGFQLVGDEEVEFPVYTKRGPAIYSVPITRFVMPFIDDDAQKASWCGEIHEFTQTALYHSSTSGLFYEDTYAKLRSWLFGQQQLDRKFDESQEDIENREPVWPTSLDIWCIWLGYDVTQREMLHEIQVYYHPESRTICGARYNWHKDLRRPYRHKPYFKVENRWTGIGIAKMNEQFQAEITTQHRQRIDSATLTNMRMFKLSKLSGYGPNEPVFPGKVWFLNDMSHIEPIPNPDIHASAYNNESQALMYSQQRTSVTEVMMGMPSVGTPDTATNTLTRVQEGRRRFDYSFGNLKDLASEVIHDVVRVIAQYGPSRLDYFEKVTGGAEVFNLLSTASDEDLVSGLLIRIAVAGERENDITLRQNWSQVASFLQQYYTSAIELATSTGDGQLVALITKKAMVASTEAMKQILETYGIRNIDKLILDNDNLQLLERLGNSGASPLNQLAGAQNPAQVGAGNVSNIIGRIGGVQ